MANDRPDSELARLRAEERNAQGPGPTRGLPEGHDKGGVSVYGLGRSPVTLYQEQWLKLRTWPTRSDVHPGERPQLKTQA